MKELDTTNEFPVSKTRTIKGLRRFIREKILQVLIAYQLSEISLDLLFNHIFFREFTFDPLENEPNKLLTPDEIFELESDVAITWPKEEVDFAIDIIQKVIENIVEFSDLIRNASENWDFERIALIDKTIIYIAICELLFYKNIPPKVTINEAVEIAKKYSTENSSEFVNGILDNIFVRLNKENRIIKDIKGFK